MKKIIITLGLAPILLMNLAYADYFNCPAPSIIKCDAQKCSIPASSLFKIIGYTPPNSNTDYSVKFNNATAVCDSQGTLCQDPVKVTNFQCGYNVGNGGELGIAWQSNHNLYSIPVPPWNVEYGLERARCKYDVNACYWSS